MATKRIVPIAYQRAAADIVIRLFMLPTANLEEALWKEIEKIEDDYQLKTDPVTKLPCDDRTFSKNYDEYQRQLFEEKYGYRP